MVHWSLCREYGLQCASRCYEQYGSKHPVMENTEVKILWDFNVETDHMIVHRRPHIVVLENEVKNSLLIDITIHGDVRIEEKEEESDEVSVSNERGVDAVTLGNNSENDTGNSWDNGYRTLYIGKGRVEVSVGLLQKIALLGTVVYLP